MPGTVHVHDHVALFRACPTLAGRVPWVRLGDWPTPVDRLVALNKHVGGELWVKRDDVSGPRYGGNKVRTLEALFGQAQAQGARRIWATGAFGSNHALASVLHAPAAGLEPGVILFPQQHSACAADNLRATLAQRPLVRAVISWATLPFAMRRERRAAVPSFVMVPGGATPVGALGYVAAALEVAEQVAAGQLPAPDRVVLGVGSTCTTAGLLVGFAVAARRGMLPPPSVVAVRVTPWPVTARFRILGLASRTARLLAELAGDASLAFSAAELGARLVTTGEHLGRGYGYATDDGRAAIARFAAAGGPPLDENYTGKSAAALFARPLPGVTLYWATKSSLPLPPADEAAIRAAPPRMRRWLDR